MARATSKSGRHSNAKRLGKAGGSYSTKGYFSKKKDFDKDGVNNRKDPRPFNPDIPNKTVLNNFKRIKSEEGGAYHNKHDRKENKEIYS